MFLITSVPDATVAATTSTIGTTTTIGTTAASEGLIITAAGSIIAGIVIGALVITVTLVIIFVYIHQTKETKDLKS